MVMKPVIYMSREKIRAGFAAQPSPLLPRSQTRLPVAARTKAELPFTWYTSLLRLWLISRGLYHHGGSGGQAGLRFGCRQAGMLGHAAPRRGITVIRRVPCSSLSFAQPRGKRGR